MPLTDAEIRALKPRGKPYKVADEKGLYLQVTAKGAKLWRFKYRVPGPTKLAEKLLALGAYPDVSLSIARKGRDAAREIIRAGGDPAAEKRRDKVRRAENAAQTFDAVAAEFITKRKREGMAETTVKKAELFRAALKPSIGSEPVGAVDPHVLLAALKKIEARGRHETANRVRSFASRVFRYAVATARASADPAALLSGGLTAPKTKHYAAILDPVKLGELLRAIDGFSGSPVTHLALQIAPHVYVRPGELRHSRWEEIDLDQAVWRIPANRMKARRPHTVPLSAQVIALFRQLCELTGGRPGDYAFPSIRTRARPMSENTLNAAFRRLGYSKDEVTAHGLRASASTLLNESGKWNPDAIERALAHGDSDAVRGAYARGQFWDERVRMATWWSDHLDALRKGADVVPIKRAAKA
jgi:integrase